MPAQPLLFALFVLTLPAPGLLLAWLLGAPPGLGRGARALLGLLISCATTSLLALGCALAGVFSLPLVLALNVALALLIAVVGRQRLLASLREAGARSPLAAGRRLVLALPLLALAAFLYFQPSEYFFGGWDPGVYLSTGANLARTGAITIHDPTLAGLPPGALELFSQERRGLRAKYPGFVVRDAAAGELQPYFNHLYPVWIALFVSGLGPLGGLWVAPLFCLLSVAALFLMGAALFGTAVGACAAAIFGLSIPIIWQSGFPTSEPLALCFSLAGWLCAVLCVRHGAGRFAGLAAVFFGCALLAKITTLPPLILLAGTGLLAGSSPASRERRALSAGLAAALLATAPYFLIVTREYTAEVFRGTLSILAGASGARLWLPAAAAGLGAWLLARTLTRFAARYRAAAGTLLAAAAAYGYFLRPAVEHSRDAANLVQLGWFVTPLALLLALAGALLVLRRPAAGRLGEAQTVFLAVAAASVAVLLYRKQIAPYYFWALRRYVPELLPALALFAAVALAAVAGRGAGGRGGRLRAGVAAVLLATVVVGGLYRGRHLLAHRDYPGALAQIAQVAAAIPAGAVTVCRESWLATPLQYQFGKPTLAVADVTPQKARQVADTLAAWVGAGREIYLADDGGEFFTRRFGLEPAARVAFDLPVLERTAARYPRAVQRFAPQVEVSRVVPFTPASARRTDRIDVGLASFGLERGFYQIERTGAGEEARSFRWTGAEAALDLPEPARELVLNLGGGRPAGAPDPRVEVLLDGVVVADLRVGPGIRPYRVPVTAGRVPATGRGYVELTLRSETFVPARTGSSKDERELGVMWASVVLAPAGSPGPRD